MSAVKAGAAYVELTTRNAALMKGLADARKRLQDFGSATRAIGMKLFGVGAAATAPLAASMAVFSSFDDAIRGVRAVTQASEKDFEKLRNKAKQLGATTSYSASQVALLMSELGRAGFSPDQIIAMTGAVMDLARATGTDATRASGIMAATIRQFGLAGEDAGRVADALTAAANKSFNSVESLGEALKYAGPIAADANMSLEETLAILGSLGNMGIQGSDAGTSLRRLLTLSAAEAKRFQKVFGVATMDAAGNVRPLVDVLGDVAAATNDLPSGERAAKFAEVFGMLGITSAGAIGKSVADTRELHKEIKASGAAAAKLTAAANNSSNSVEALGEALESARPIAADANLGLEETLALLSSLGDMGVRGSHAGNALKRLLNLSAAEARQFQQVFGVAATDAAGSVRPLVDVLGDVAAATNDLPGGERAAKFAEVFGMLGITSAGAIGKSVADTRKLYEEIKAAGGAASSTAKEMESGIGGSFRILKSSLEGVSIAIGEALSAPLQRMTEALSGTLSGVIKWIEKNNRLIRVAAAIAVGVMAVGAALVGLGGAFAVAGMVIGGFLSTMTLVSGAIAAGGAVIAGLLSPLGLVSAAVIGLGGYLVHASGLGGTALAWLGARFEALKGEATESFGAIGKALAAGDIGRAAKILWLTLRLEWLKGINFLQGYWVAFKDSMLSVTDAMVYGLAGIISDGWASVEVAWSETIGFLADTWSLFTGTLAKTWHSTVGFIKKAWVRLKGLFDSDIDVKAEVRRIDDDTSAKNEAATEQMLGAMGQREQERERRREEVERERQGRAESLGSMRQSEDAARRQAGEDAVATAAADLQTAKQEWKAAIEALGSEGKTETGEPTSPLGSAIEALKKSLAQSGEVVTAEKQAIENKSTFNAFAIRGLGADSLSDRQLRAMEQTAANTRKLIKVIEDNGLAYS